MNVKLTIHKGRLQCKFIAGLFILVILTTITSCKKDFLDTRPRTDILVPVTLKDFQQLLDNYDIMNETPQLGELSADNFYLTSDYWNTLLSPHEKNGYIWAPDVFGTQKNVPDWNIPYTQVLYANVILEGLEKIEPPFDQQEWNNIKGSALFVRAFAFYNLAQLFAKQFDNATASTDPGIPLRLNSDINEKVQRSSVQQTYKQVTDDLILASQLLLPAVQSKNRNRPSKPAALALLARVYLTIGDYTKAKQFATDAIQSHNQLLNYNNTAEVRPQSLSPFISSISNKEMIYQTQMYAISNIFPALTFPDCIVDSTLYQSYSTDDLRGAAYYTTLLSGKPNLKRSYIATIFPFSGLATDELYLTRAECNAWLGNVPEAMDDLNALLITRWKTNTYVPYTATTQTGALTIILNERRKELAFRGIRWTDLRRLNKTAFNTTLQRIVNGNTPTLTPGSKLWVLPIPPDVIALGDIEQNVRQ